MKQTFTDIPASSRLQRLRRLRRQGWTALGPGLAIVTLLLAGNLAAFIAGDDLRREDAAYRQPPQWPFLQRLLYQPPVAVTPYVEGSDLLDGFDTLMDDPSDAAETQEEPSRPLAITSRPRFTAVVGRPYRYRVRANGPGHALRYDLLMAPIGMAIDDAGLIQWTPEAAQAGGRGHAVEVTAVGPDGQGSRQAFTIIVSERVHPLGTDEAGRDLGAALILGARWTVLPGVVAVSVSLLLGLLFGGLAGYYAGRTDAVLSYLTHLSEAFPALVLLFLAAVIFRYNLYPVMGVLGVILFPGVARGVKARVLALKARQFIEASRELGLSDAEILWKDIIWHNTRPFLLRRVFYGFALAVVVEVTLSYLNIGILPPTVSWGNLILEGRGLIETRQYGPAFFPAAATVVAVAGYYLLGSGLERRFRVKNT